MGWSLLMPFLPSTRGPTIEDLARAKRLAVQDLTSQAAVPLPAPDMAPADDGGALRIAGEDALTWALAEWSATIVDGPRGSTGQAAARSFGRIDSYIRGPLGLGWGSVETGPHARPNVAYSGDGSFEWCGAFAARAWERVRADVRRRCFSSPYRLHTWAAGSGRLIRLEDARPGDILLIGDGSPHWGDHVGLLESSAGKLWRTVEGNATGKLGNGRRGQGVVRCERPVYTTGPGFRVLHVVRPLLSDLYPESTR